MTTSHVLITGGNGFIGRAVVRALLALDMVPIVLLHPNETCSQEFPSGVITERCDLFDVLSVQPILHKYQPKRLIHLAWFVKHSEFWTSQENLRWVAATLQLVEQFRQHGGKYILAAGTCAEYDWSGGGVVDEEKTPRIPATFYGQCKYHLHGLLQVFGDQFGLKVCWLRIFFPYGPGESQGRLIPALLAALRNKQPFACRSGNLIRDFIYIDDLSTIFALCAAGEIAGTYNAGTGCGISLGEVSRFIASALRAEELLTVEDTAIDSRTPLELIASPKKLRDALPQWDCLPFAQRMNEYLALSSLTQ